MSLPKWIKTGLVVIAAIVALLIVTSILSYRHATSRIEALKERAEAGPLKWDPITVKGIVGTLETNYTKSTNRATFTVKLNASPPSNSKINVFVGLGQQIAAHVTITDKEFKQNGEYWIAEAHTKKHVSAVKYGQATQWVLMIADPEPEAKDGRLSTD